MFYTHICNLNDKPLGRGEWYEEKKGLVQNFQDFTEKVIITPPPEQVGNLGHGPRDPLPPRDPGDPRSIIT